MLQGEIRNSFKPICLGIVIQDLLLLLSNQKTRIRRDQIKSEDQERQTVEGQSCHLLQKITYRITPNTINNLPMPQLH